MPFTLRSLPPSPFGRKVEIAAAVLGLTDEITIEPAYATDENDSLRRQNPLGKIPALILGDGEVLYDSRVIVEYLDTVAGGGLIPAEREPRFRALRGAALADGIIDAAILIVYEARFRPDQEPYGPWLDYQRGKIARGVAALDAAPPEIDPVTVASIGAACALDYLDFRGQYDWRPAHPGLITWLDAFAAAVPAFGETRPRD